MRNCPNCRHSINSTAIVDTFLDPAEWQFWGERGQRWMVCVMPSYIHFRVILAHGQQHRMAIIRGQAAQWLETERAAAEQLDTSRNHVDRLSQDVYAKQDDWLSEG